MIPPKFVKLFDSAAAKEAKKLKLVRPKDLSIYSFLYRQNVRICRAITVVDSVRKRRDKAATRDSHKKKSSKRSYELVASSSLKVVSFGEITPASFRLKGVPVPIGFVAERAHQDDATQKQHYRCSIIERRGLPRFLVVPMDGTETEYEGDTPSNAWKGALQFEEKGITKVKLQGATLFGLCNPMVKERLAQMVSDYQESNPRPPTPPTPEEIPEEWILEPFHIDVTGFDANMFAKPRTVKRPPPSNGQTPQPKDKKKKPKHRLTFGTDDDQDLDFL
jgi:hypothetical protein